MNRGMHFLVTATSSLISNHNRKKTLNKIKKVNADSKGIVDLGHVDADSLIAEKEMIANICITGGSEKVRNSHYQMAFRLLSYMRIIIALHTILSTHFRENVIADQSVKWSLSMSR